ncbi:hypothetical protein SAMN04487947_2434 [Halogeometricum rufum]|uniref:DUF8106 domain-containing protein n=1 Tax=Halogeometricum rufum TaxID=553469 RepID=A0A1I6HSP0_9EURY|nr:hypothetical protein [Halogeometricum rufum]SFR57443.1 hypothetical protein SAMN04487947_2434 [Halogeometricum rufum]
MNALTRRSRERQTTTTPKAVLFCPACGRAAPVDEWLTVATRDAESLSCPDCGETLTVR